jgi:hypothetical protein
MPRNPCICRGYESNSPVLERRCIFEAAALASADALDAAMFALLAGAVFVFEMVIIINV